MHFPARLCRPAGAPANPNILHPPCPSLAALCRQQQGAGTECPSLFCGERSCPPPELPWKSCTPQKIQELNTPKDAAQTGLVKSLPLGQGMGRILVSAAQRTHHAPKVDSAPLRFGGGLGQQQAPLPGGLWRMLGGKDARE